MRYITMTVGGLYGDTFTEPGDFEAELSAEKAGYTVLDITDGAGEFDAVIVVKE